MYFPIHEILEVFLGIGFDFKFYPDIKEYPYFYDSSNEQCVSFCSCETMKKLAHERSKDHQETGIQKLHIGSKLWSDDFDPSGGSKSNRNNVWICTLTFNKKDNVINSSDNTFVVALGKKAQIMILYFNRSTLFCCYQLQ